jgi:ribose/xylose/arabinose/galactoside ABC-type transport system permease subunit
MSDASIVSGPAGPQRLSKKYAAVLTTLALLILMFTIGAIRYPGFGSAQVILNLFVDNAFLLPVAVGMTFVILTGGIDLVGSLLGLTLG